MGNHWRSLDCRRHLNRINICYSVERLLIVRLVSKASSIWLRWVMDVYCTSKCRGQVNSSAAALWPCWKIICIHVDTRHFIRRPPLLPVRLSSCFVTCFLLIGLIPALFFILLPVLNRLDCLQLSQHPHTLTHTHSFLHESIIPFCSVALCINQWGLLILYSNSDLGGRSQLWLPHRVTSIHRAEGGMTNSCSNK